MKFIYNIGIRAYVGSVYLAGLFGNKKAQKWYKGRQNWRSILRQEIQSDAKIIWLHATSLGEFDQAKPLLEKIRNDHSFNDYKILGTFFSPSGYEYSKKSPLLDHIYYLPSDLKKNAFDFIEIVDPKIAIFVKYDFWMNFLTTLQHKKIPTLYFSCNFRKNQIYFKSWNNWQLDILKNIDSILTLNKESRDILLNHNFKNTEICGDTRFDKAIQNAERAKKVTLIESFKQDKKLLILGSSWEREEAALFHFIKAYPAWRDSLKIVIAPHNVYDAHIQEIIKLSPHPTLLFSEADENNISQHDILIINNIGMLSNLYQYGDIAFIGGGFTNKLHNILEAATFSNTILFGANHNKFPEAELLIKHKGGFELEKPNDFATIVKHLLTDNQLLENSQKNARKFIIENTGATEKVFGKFKELI